MAKYTSLEVILLEILHISADEHMTQQCTVGSDGPVPYPSLRWHNVPRKYTALFAHSRPYLIRMHA